MNITALVLVISAGLMLGSYAVPIKLTPDWHFENTWLAYCFLGLVVFPLVVAVVTVPHLGQVLSTSPLRGLCLVALLGLAFGCGSVFFGLGLRELGVGLAYSINFGLGSSLGAIIPWLTTPAKSLAYSILLWAGVLVMLMGIVICGLAGQERARKLGLEASEKQDRRKFLVGLAICIASGVLSCCMNLGLAYGSEILRRAEALGADVNSAPNVLWLIIMGCGFIPILLYYGYLLWSKQSWRKYRTKTVRYLGWTVVMALLLEGGLVAYGAGANRLGHLGPSVGWPMLMSISIVTSNTWGAATGEWRNAGRQAANTMITGIVIISIAVFILAWASSKL